MLKQTFSPNSKPRATPIYLHENPEMFESGLQRELRRAKKLNRVISERKSGQTSSESKSVKFQDRNRVLNDSTNIEMSPYSPSFAAFEQINDFKL